MFLGGGKMGGRCPIGIIPCEDCPSCEDMNPCCGAWCGAEGNPDDETGTDEEEEKGAN